MRGVVLSGALLATAYAGGCGGISKVVQESAGAGDETASAGRGGSASGARGGNAGGGGLSSGGRGGRSAGGAGGRGFAGRGGSVASGGAGGWAGNAGAQAVAGRNAGTGQGADAGSGGEAGAPIDPVADLTRDILTTDLVIDTSNRSGTATITLAPSSSRRASFEVGDLSIRSVESSSAARDFVAKNGQLDVDVPASTEPLTLVIKYTYAFHETMDGVSADGYTFTWPYNCGNVFPCHSDPADGVRFSLNVSGGDYPLVYASEIPFEAPSYMLAWTEVHGTFAEYTPGVTASGISLSVAYDASAFGTPGAVGIGASHLAPVFDWFETHLGAYQFGLRAGAVSVVWPQGVFAIGMEHHPFWHIAQDSLNDALTQVHEAAHGWFGNGIRLRCWGDLVLSEGTASYLAARVLEEAWDVDWARFAWLSYEALIDDHRATDYGVAWLEDCSKDAVDYLGSDMLLYARGASFYRALEQRIGRPLLDEALSVFYEAQVGKAAGFQDLLDTVYETSGYDPTTCAHAWLTANTIPQFVPCD